MTEKAVQFDWEKITGPLGETEDIFKDEIERIEKLCNEYDFEKNSSNVISIVGNRGCGKTSLIKAVQKHFDENKNFYVTDTIDPSIFDDTLLIPEFFISVLAQQVEKSKENGSGEFAEFHKKLNEIMEVISHIKSNKERFYEDNHPSDIVRTIQKRYRFDELLKELITSFYKAIGKATDTKMIVCIDDLDLVSNKYVYRMIEDIQKWLNKNCIVILSFREVQLLNIIQDQFIKQNMNLIDKEIISISEIRDQAIQFYEKQMPVSRRIYLKGQKEFFNETSWDILKPFVKNMMEINKSENDNKKDEECTDNEFIWKCLKNEEINFHDFMEKMVRRKVALPLDPVDEKERVHLIYPNGLREMLAFVRMLVEMPEIHDKDDSILKEKLQQNLKNYQNYVLSRAKANLDDKYYSVLDEWIKTSVENKNYYMCSKLDKLLRDYYASQGESEYGVLVEKYHNGDLIYIERTEPYNVMLGDVIQFTGVVKRCIPFDEQVMYFCYLIKLLYSISLLNNLMLLKEDDLTENKEAPVDADDFLDGEEHDIENVKNETDEEKNKGESINTDPIKSNEDIGRDGDEYCLPDNAYSKLVNCKFMPDDYFYAQKDSNLVDHVSVLKTHKTAEGLKQIVKQICYSRIKNERTWKSARPKSFSEKRDFSSFKHMYHDQIVIENDEKSEWNDNNNINYRSDPLSAVLKKNYLLKAIQNGGYLFYSLFDVDVFMRVTFYNKKSCFVEKIYEKINWLLDEKGDSKNHSQYEIGLKKMLSKMKFCQDNCSELFNIHDVRILENMKLDNPILSADEEKVRNFLVNITFEDWKDISNKMSKALLDDDASKAKNISNHLKNVGKKSYKSWYYKDLTELLKKYPQFMPEDQ